VQKPANNVLNFLKRIINKIFGDKESAHSTSTKESTSKLDTHQTSRKKQGKESKDVGDVEIPEEITYSLESVLRGKGSQDKYFAYPRKNKKAQSGATTKTRHGKFPNVNEQVKSGKGIN